ncbi:hypothetical protein EYR40_001611 [Pleurotus pulmonarius]|nr:hypothetical protein EYR36_000031 [Pleurotus pulmonarius]KAF4604431.1 hypothetical protein EYR38_004853 [Pleurotus pulmonarius]KAF4609258.1 hypothetical protein EYR40_001611 [Pleurotus pulmonarius]
MTTIHITISFNPDSGCFMTPEEQYDAQICHLREEISRLSTRRNAEWSVTRKLPSEILSLIFVQCAITDDTGPSPSCEYLSHVSKLWRTVALNEPRLWTNLEGLSGQWIQECVKRSKAAPLRIVYVGDSDDSDDDFEDDDSMEGEGEILGTETDFASFNSSLPPWERPEEISFKAREMLEPLFDLPAKIGELHVETCRSDLLSRLDTPAPVLSALTLERVRVPDNFVGGYAPRLHLVTLRSSRVQLGAPWLKNVRHLNLCRWTGETSASTILSALAHLTHLEFLSMSFPSMLLTMDSNCNQIILPNLSTAQFCFSTSQLVVVDVLNFISCPKIHRFSINWPPGFMDVTLASRATRFFCRNCDFVPDTLQWGDGASCDRTRVQLAIRQDNPERGNLPRLMFRNCFRLPIEEYLTEAFPHVQLRYLKLHSGAPKLTDHPIEELSIGGGVTLGVMLDQSPVYPTLRHIVLTQVSLTPKARKFPALKRWLKAQRKIEKLTIVGSLAFTQKDIQALEKIVGRVELVNPRG